MKFDTTLNMAAMLSVASGHVIMQAINGNAQGVGLYMPSDNSYQFDVKSQNMACSGAPVGGFRTPKQKISIQAGSTVTAAWLHQLDSTDSHWGDAVDNKVIGSSHKGPLMAYMKKVPDSLQNPAAGPGDGWFKIAESGLISSSKWAVDELIQSGGLQKVQIPTCLANGDYLLRFELIALHSAFETGGAQFYISCASVTVTGGTGTASPATVSFPGAYSATDPGIKVGIYNGLGQPYPSSYKIPGPAVYSCPAGGAAPANPATPATPATPAAGQAGAWAQCGGIGWTGATGCVSGYTCKVINDYYYQCT